MADGLGSLPSWDEPRIDDIQIRQSDINQLELCPGRHGLMLTHPDAKPRVPSEPLVFGSVVHNLTEMFLVNPSDDGIPLNLLTDKAITMAITLVEDKDDFAIGDVATDAQLATFIEQAREALVLWHEQVFALNFEADLNLVVEERMLVPLGTIPDYERDVGVWLHGTPDVVLPGVSMTDWKTSGRAWKVTKAGYTKGSFGPQAPLYLWMWYKLTGDWISEFTFVVYDRSKKEWGSYTTHWTLEQAEAAVANAWQWAKVVAGGAYPYTPAQYPFGTPSRGWYCSAKFCDVWDICPAKGMLNDGVDLGAKGLTTW